MKFCRCTRRSSYEEGTEFDRGRVYRYMVNPDDSRFIRIYYDETTYGSISKMQFNCSFEAITPQFVHDCDQCQFLGTHKGNLLNYDLYVCGVDRKMQTVLARYGNNGPDYSSGKYEPRQPILEVAYRKALAAGWSDQ